MVYKNVTPIYARMNIIIKNQVFTLLESALEIQSLSIHMYYLNQFSSSSSSDDTIHHILQLLHLENWVVLPRHQALHLEVKHFNFFVTRFLCKTKMTKNLLKVCVSNPTFACVEVLVSLNNGATKSFPCTFWASCKKKFRCPRGQKKKKKEEVVCGSCCSQAILCGDFYLFIIYLFWLLLFWFVSLVDAGNALPSHVS